MQIVRDPYGQVCTRNPQGAVPVAYFRQPTQRGALWCHASVRGSMSGSVFSVLARVFSLNPRIALLSFT